MRCHFSFTGAITDQTSANQEQRKTDFAEQSMAGTAGGLSLLCISKFLLDALSHCSFKKLLRKGAALIALLKPHLYRSHSKSSCHMEAIESKH